MENMEKGFLVGEISESGTDGIKSMMYVVPVE